MLKRYLQDQAFLAHHCLARALFRWRPARHRGLGDAQKIKHQGTAPNLPDGVGNALTGNVRGRAVHWLKKRRKLAIRIQTGARRNADGAGTRRAQVTQDVAKQIAGHHNVEKVGPLHKVSRQAIDVKLVERDVWVGPGHFGHPLLPVGHGDGNTVGLGGAGQVFSGP